MVWPPILWLDGKNRGCYSLVRLHGYHLWALGYETLGANVDLDLSSADRFQYDRLGTVK